MREALTAAFAGRSLDNSIETPVKHRGLKLRRRQRLSLLFIDHNKHIESHFGLEMRMAGLYYAYLHLGTFLTPGDFQAYIATLAGSTRAKRISERKQRGTQLESFMFQLTSCKSRSKKRKPWSRLVTQMDEGGVDCCGDEFAFDTLLREGIEANPGPIKYRETVGYTENLLDLLWQTDPVVAQTLADDESYTSAVIERNLQWEQKSPLYMGATTWVGLHQVKKVGFVWVKHLPALPDSELYHSKDRKNWVRCSKLSKAQRKAYLHTELQPQADQEGEASEPEATVAPDSDTAREVGERSGTQTQKRKKRVTERRARESQDAVWRKNLTALFDTPAAQALIETLSGTERDIAAVWRTWRKSALSKKVDMKMSTVEAVCRIYLTPETSSSSDSFEVISFDSDEIMANRAPRDLTRENIEKNPGPVDTVALLEAGAAERLALAEAQAREAALLQSRAEESSVGNTMHGIASGLRGIAEPIADQIPLVGGLIKAALNFPTVPISEGFVGSATRTEAPRVLQEKAATLRRESEANTNEALKLVESATRARGMIMGGPAVRNFRASSVLLLITILGLLMMAGVEQNPGPQMHGYSAIDLSDSKPGMGTDTVATWEVSDADLDSYVTGKDPGKFFKEKGGINEAGLADQRAVTDFEVDFMHGLTVTGPRNSTADPNENLTGVQMNFARGDLSGFESGVATEQEYWPSMVRTMAGAGGAWVLVGATGWPLADISATRTSYVRDDRVDTPLAADLERLGTQIVSRSTWQGATIKGDRAQDIFTMSTLPGEQLPEFTAPCLKLLALVSALQAREGAELAAFKHMFRSISSWVTHAGGAVVSTFGVNYAGTHWAGVPFAISRFGPQNAANHRFRIYLDWDSATAAPPDYTRVYFSDIYDVRDFALFLWMVSEFPAVNFAHDALFNPGPQHVVCSKIDFMWRIFGANNIAIILSSAYATPLFAPAAGPDAFGAFIANQILQASTHAAAVDYPIGDFMMTWLGAQGLRSSDVQMFSQTVVRDLNARYDMEAARYIYPTISRWYRPPVRVTMPDNTGIFTENDYFGGAAEARLFMPHLDVYGTRGGTTSYLLHSGTGLVLPMTDWASVTKLWLGFQKSTFQTRSKVTYTQNEHSPLARRWTTLIARLIRCAHEAALSSTGTTCSALQTVAPANLTNDSICKAVREMVYGVDNDPPALQYLAVAFLAFLSGNLFPESKLGYDVFKAVRRSERWGQLLDYSSLSSPITLSTAEWYSVCRRVPTEFLYPARRAVWQLKEADKQAMTRTYGLNISVPSIMSPYNIKEHSLSEFTNSKIAMHSNTAGMTLDIVDGDATRSAITANISGNILRAKRPDVYAGDGVAHGWPFLVNTLAFFDFYQNRRVQMRTPVQGAISALVGGSYSRDIVSGAPDTFTSGVLLPFFVDGSGVSARVAALNTRAKRFFLAAEMDNKPVTGSTPSAGSTEEIAAGGGPKTRA